MTEAVESLKDVLYTQELQMTTPREKLKLWHM